MALWATSENVGNENRAFQGQSISKPSVTGTTFTPSLHQTSKILFKQLVTINNDNFGNKRLPLMDPLNNMLSQEKNILEQRNRKMSF